MKKGTNGSGIYGGYTIQSALEEAGRCLLCHDAPCSIGCPGGTDPARFIRQIRFQNFKGATRTVMGNNALGGACTHICPTDETCVGACLREKLDTPIDIAGLQRFAVEYGRAHGVEPPSKSDPIAKKVAVLGAGPAGLSAAGRLVRRGYRVTVFDRRDEAGGMLRYGVPKSRLGLESLVGDVAILKELGVEMKLGTEIVGADPAATLLEQGFDAVFMAPGLWKARTLDAPGVELSGVTTAIGFLGDAHVDPASCDELVSGKRVAIIGGGSVAMDVARVAKEHGATRVYAVALEGMNELPAQREELDAAREVGLQILANHRITRVLGESGKVVGIEGVETEWIKPGSFAPNNARDVDGSSFRLKVDVVVQAIGQVTELQEKLQTAESLAVTGRKGVFAGGDIVRGAGTAIAAVGDGRAAAEAIHEYLGGKDQPVPGPKMMDLSVDFCGVKFPNPFCLSSSPVGNDYDMCARSLDMGWGGVMYKTIAPHSEVKITHPSPRLNALHRGAQRVVGIQNLEQISDRTAAENFADVARLKKDFPKKAIVASIMGLTRMEEWAELAKRAEDAGADLIECNFSCPQMTVEGTGHKVGQDADVIEKLTSITKRACSIPVIAKLTPNVADMLPAALGAQAGGADAVSAINTVKAISELDLELCLPKPNIEGHSSSSGFSGTAMKPIALRFVSDMARDPRLKIPISGMGGIYTWREAAEFLLLGATTLQVTTAILHHGYRIIDDLTEGLSDFIRDRGFTSVQEMIGKALPAICDPSELSHDKQAISVIDEEKCIGCGQCFLSCRDGAAYAIQMTEDRVAKVDEDRCFGCLMCKHVCPVDGCITYKLVPHHFTHA